MVPTGRSVLNLSILVRLDLVEEKAELFALQHNAAVHGAEID